jgi:hypothetical protein
MSKKAQAEVVVPSAVELGLEGAVASHYESLSKELKLDLVEMLQEDRAATIVYLETGLSLASSTVDGVEFEEATFDSVEVPVYGPGDAIFQKGMKTTLEFVGTVFTPTYEKIANWKTAKDAEGNTYYTNSQFEFKTMDGKTIRVWRSPMLSILEKVATHTSAPTHVAKNPLVQIEYHGLIEGADEVKRITGITLESGDSMHNFTVNLEKGARVEKYIAGCINMLNSPLPIKKAGQKLDRNDQNKANYEKLMAMQNGGPIIEQAQITQ